MLWSCSCRKHDHHGYSPVPCTPCMYMYYAHSLHLHVFDKEAMQCTILSIYMAIKFVSWYIVSLGDLHWEENSILCLWTLQRYDTYTVILSLSLYLPTYIHAYLHTYLLLVFMYTAFSLLSNTLVSCIYIHCLCMPRYRSSSNYWRWLFPKSVGCWGSILPDVL